MKDLYILEWSRKQNAFHIQTALLAFEKNLNVLLADESTDYVPIFLGTRGGCEVIQKRYRDRLNGLTDNNLLEQK